MLVVGVDIGTQSLKAVVADENLAVIGEASFGYVPTFPRPGWAEQHPDLWTNAIGPGIAGALGAAGRSAADVGVLAVVGQLDGCIPADASGRALAPCIIWPDRRAAGDIAGIDPQLVRERAGLALDATHMAAKIRWCARELDVASRVRVWHQPVSYMLEQLTGARVYDHGLASTTMLYNLKDRDHDDELLGVFAIDKRQLPSISDAFQAAGPLTSAGAALTGLLPGIPVAIGTGDDFSNPLGSGVLAPGTVAVSLGTAEVVGAVSTAPVMDASLLVETHGYFSDRYFLSNPGWLCGGAVTWLRGIISVASAAELSALAATVAPGSDGLLFLPALSGAVTPRWITGARGAFYGLTPAHGKAHLARALLEGTSFAMLDVVERLAELAAPVSRLRLMGGGARSAIWGKIRADVSGLETEVCSEVDSSPRGAVILGSVAAGIYPTVEAAVAAMPAPMKSIEPDPAMLDRYRNAYSRYRILFEALAPLYGG